MAANDGTHTFAILDISPAAYDEIAEKLRAGGYDHAFILAMRPRDGSVEGKAIIDMHGIALGYGSETDPSAQSDYDRALDEAIRISKGQNQEYLSSCKEGHDCPHKQTSQWIRSGLIELKCRAKTVDEICEPWRVIMLCRRHDFGLCTHHRGECGQDGMPCVLVPWPEGAGTPWCAVCQGRLRRREAVPAEEPTA